MLGIKILIHFSQQINFSGIFTIILPDIHMDPASKRIVKSCLSWAHRHYYYRGVTLAQLVKASVGQADIQRFEPHLGHNLLSCGVFIQALCVFIQALWTPSGTNHKAKLAISLSGWLGRYTNVEYLQSLYLKRRGQLLFQV